MDIAVTEFRSHLRDWIARAREGEEVVITDRGVPVARLSGVDTTTQLERLIASGVVAQPASTRRPAAKGRKRPTPRRPVADVISQQRD